MTTRSVAAVLVLVVMVTSTMAEEGMGKASSPPVDCITVAANMADCLSYVSNGSTTDKPGETCCNELKLVLKTNPECLCEMFQQSKQIPNVDLNMTKALNLPSACCLHAPSITNCALTPARAPASVVAPASAPSPAKAPSSGTEPSKQPPKSSPSNTGSKTGSSSSIGVSVYLIIAGLVAALATSFST